MGLINQGSHNWGAPSSDGDWPHWPHLAGRSAIRPGRAFFFRARPGGFLFEVMKPTWKSVYEFREFGCDLHCWLVVWNLTFIFHNIWDNPSHWHIFQRGWNHQPDWICEDHECFSYNELGSVALQWFLARALGVGPQRCCLMVVLAMTSGDWTCQRWESYQQEIQQIGLSILPK